MLHGKRKAWLVPVQAGPRRAPRNRTRDTDKARAISWEKNTPLNNIIAKLMAVRVLPRIASFLRAVREDSRVLSRPTELQGDRCLLLYNTRQCFLPNVSSFPSVMQPSPNTAYLRVRAQKPTRLALANV